MAGMNQESDMSGSTRAIAAGFVIMAMAWSMFFGGFHVIPASIMAAAITLLAGQAISHVRYSGRSTKSD